MNKYEIEKHARNFCRIAGLSDYEEDVNLWIDFAARYLCQTFEIPSMKMRVTIQSVDEQERYDFPYVYDGTDVDIWYGSRKLDPWSEEFLELSMDRRPAASSSRGPVHFYDWSGEAESPTLLQSSTQGGVITNRSATVTSAANPFLAAHVDEWVRFDPWTDADGDLQNPGEFGYRIKTLVSAGNVTLYEPYRGPSSVPAFPCGFQIRPRETQQFRLYGIPQEDDEDIVVEVYRRPRRLYNNEDVPEWPALGLPIAAMAVSMGFHFLGDEKEAMMWESKSERYMGAIKRRRKRTRTLSPRVPRTSVVGRPIGPVNIRSYGGIR